MAFGFARHHMLRMRMSGQVAIACQIYLTIIAVRLIALLVFEPTA